ncbi:hypothetical protein VTN00DRAFT_2386 [Thermoascus crustaceus]|uniref:uncharacterized protein n=1 Tax=Thermoascus crustaceus TaxID=5088 RepID=UPI00374423D5
MKATKLLGVFSLFAAASTAAPLFDKAAEDNALSSKAQQNGAEHPQWPKTNAVVDDEHSHDRQVREPDFNYWRQ